MDIVTATGTKFYISDDQVDDTLVGFHSISDWMEVGQVESISEFGDESEDILRMAIGQTRGEHLKGVRGPVGLNIVTAHDYLDTGQDEFDIAEGVAVQFAFRVVIPVAEHVDNVIYFQALVRSNKWDVGNNNNVVRRNFACTLNSEIIIEDTVSRLIAIPGVGNFSVYARQRSLITARFAGAGGMSALAIGPSRININVNFIGAGALSVLAIVPERNLISIAASLAGAGTLVAYSRQASVSYARFTGAGGFTVNTTVITNFLLLRDGVSRLLLRDGVSRLRLRQ